MMTAPMVLETSTANDAAPIKPEFDRKALEAYDMEVINEQRRYDAHHVTFTDCKANAGALKETKRAAKNRAMKLKPGEWEGPRIVFVIHYGLSHPWYGPGTSKVEFPDGSYRCRGCGHLPKMPRAGVCHHCQRSGADNHREIRSVRPKPCDPKPETPIVGPLTRRQKRAVRV